MNLIALLLLALLIVAVVKLGPSLMLKMAIAAQRRAAGLRQSTLSVTGHEITYLDGGSGEPLILIHGFGAEKDNWTPVARHLTQRFRVIAPDLPPFGETPGWEGASYSIDAQVERVRAFARELGLTRFHLGGNSMGGAIAGRYAGRYAEDLLSLWLLAPAGVEAADPSELEELLEKGENPLLVSSPDEFRALMEFAMEERPYIPGAVLKHLAGIAVERRPVYDAVFEELTREREGAAPSLEQVLSGSEVPTLIAWGDRDRLLHVSGATVLEGVIKNAKVQILEGIGHVPMIERPEQSAAALVGFLDGRER